MYFLFRMHRRFATMLSSHKQTDGFQKIVSVSDIQRLKTAAMRETLDSFEILVKDSWELCSSAQVTGASLERVFGKLCVRATLFVLGKDGKDKGGTDKHFADLPEIACAFASELKKGKTETSASKGSQAASSTGSSSVTNVLECKPEEVALMQNSHMQLGGMLLGCKPLEIYRLYTSREDVFGCKLIRYTNVKEHGNKIFVFLKTDENGVWMEHAPLGAKGEGFRSLRALGQVAEVQGTASSFVPPGHAGVEDGA